MSVADSPVRIGRGWRGPPFRARRSRVSTRGHRARAADAQGHEPPYISHPVHVARLLERAGCSEDVFIAGLLHDVLEDADMRDGGTRQCLREAFQAFGAVTDDPTAYQAALDRLIKDEFGPTVYDLVRAVTEQKKDGGRRAALEGAQARTASSICGEPRKRSSH